MRACYLHNSNFTSVIVKVKKVLYFLIFVLRCRIFSVMLEGKLKLTERISPFHKLPFAKILHILLRKSLVIVNVPENCNHICAKIIFVKLLCLCILVGGKVDTATLPRGSSTICHKLLEGTSSLQSFVIFLWFLFFCLFRISIFWQQVMLKAWCLRETCPGFLKTCHVWEVSGCS